MGTAQCRVRHSYIWDNRHIDLLGLDNWIRRWLVQGEWVLVIELSSLRFLRLVLYGCPGTLPLLANHTVVERRYVVAVAGTDGGACGGLVRRRGAVGRRGVAVGRIVVWGLRGGVGRVLAIHGIVCRRGGGLSLLVRVSCRAIRCGSAGPCWGRLARRLLIVVIVNDDNFLG